MITPTSQEEFDVITRNLLTKGNHCIFSDITGILAFSFLFTETVLIFRRPSLDVLWYGAVRPSVRSSVRLLASSGHVQS